MSAPLIVLAIPFGAALLLALVRDPTWAARFNATASLATFIAALALLAAPRGVDGLLFVDEMNAFLVVLTSFVACTTSLFSARYIAHEIEIGKLTALSQRFYHAMYQALAAAMLTALLTDNVAIMWVAIEASTLITVVMVSIYRTRAAIEAAWKYFILASVGIALALFGTILVYLAAQPVIGEGMEALSWTHLRAAAARLDASVLNLAFVFLLVGYGTKIGLAPLHAWLPDAHAEGPTPITAVMSGLLLNIALYAVLRFKLILGGNAAALSPGPLLLAMGSFTVLFAGLMLYRQRDIKRFFAYSSVEHMGIVVFAFGLGGGAANFAGLMHLVLHSVTKSAIFFAVGQIAQSKGTQRMSELSGLTTSHPALGWGLVVGVVAIAGLPPLGLFMSEFLIVTAAMAREPWQAAPLVVGLALAFGALVTRIQQVAFGAPRGTQSPVSGSLIPLYLHLAIVLTAGLWLPSPMVAWLRGIAASLGG